jgi:hypothetical protein
MTELDRDPADRRPVPHDDQVATAMGRTGPDPAMPNYATTDIDPTSGSARPDDVHDPDAVHAPGGVRGAAVEVGLLHPPAPDRAAARSDLNRFGLGPEDPNMDVAPDPAAAGRGSPSW